MKNKVFKENCCSIGLNWAFFKNNHKCIFITCLSLMIDSCLIRLQGSVTAPTWWTTRDTPGMSTASTARGAASRWPTSVSSSMETTSTALTVPRSCELHIRPCRGSLAKVELHQNWLLDLFLMRYESPWEFLVGEFKATTQQKLSVYAFTDQTSESILVKLLLMLADEISSAKYALA